VIFNVILMTLKRRHYLNDKAVRRVLGKFFNDLKLDYADLLDGGVEAAYYEPNVEVFLIGKNIAFVKRGDELFPILLYEPLLKVLQSIIVDMGAVSHICNGADVMAPGVVCIDGDFDENSIVVVRDKKNDKPLAIVRTLYSASDMRNIKQGKVAENLHYVGDELWELSKKIKS
jgi:PUA-domain protein